MREKDLSGCFALKPLRRKRLRWEWLQFLSIFFALALAVSCVPQRGQVARLSGTDTNPEKMGASENIDTSDLDALMALDTPIIPGGEALSPLESFYVLHHSAGMGTIEM